MVTEKSKSRPILTDSFVESIIRSEKFIPEKISDVGDRSQYKLENGQYRLNIDLECSGYRLRMAIRQLFADPLDFSILLIYYDQDGYDYIIKRYNGDHGIHKNPMTGDSFSGPHIHTITEWCQIHTHIKVKGRPSILMLISIFPVRYRRICGTSTFNTNTQRT